MVLGADKELRDRVGQELGFILEDLKRVSTSVEQAIPSIHNALNRVSHIPNMARDIMDKEVAGVIHQRDELKLQVEQMKRQRDEFKRRTDKYMQDGIELTQKNKELTKKNKEMEDRMSALEDKVGTMTQETILAVDSATEEPEVEESEMAPVEEVASEVVE